ncbi:hypothetical protein [Cytobacillus oceanisediminis]|uniref:Transposase n=1 Tax=Cytobacillus oceanisediminis TaxID=665099 RepID=A0ABX3CKF5_9BACI|nr:hypothetical protein [Cytobacillus oceanisediminis]OHX39219.1 hypothetical protein BBV17_03740 [Cytobacillus oceanisediminis]
MKIDYQKLREFFRILANALKRIWEAWQTLKTEVIEWHQSYYQEKRERKKRVESWYVPMDTRKPSQMINNKPRNMVRKVIR